MNKTPSDGQPEYNDPYKTQDTAKVISGPVVGRTDQPQLLHEGQDIPGFQLVSELGRGQFGVVYLALDKSLDRNVAIKVPLFDDPGQYHQYVKEARHAAKLDIPGIVPVYQVGVLGSGQPFIVQKYIEGTTLRKEMKGAGNVSLRRACSLVARIAKALAQAHEKDLVHRDLKPDNILIDLAGDPWIADFGLAVFEKDPNRPRFEFAGTPAYMAPEQYQGRTDWLDGRSDIYSMGIMLYELLVGKTPFEATSRDELKEQVLNRAPKPISQRVRGIPADIDAIFQHCCDKQPSQRYSNAVELAEDLEAVLPYVPEDPRASDHTQPHYSSGGLASARRRQVGVSTHRGPAHVTVQDTRRPTRIYTYSAILSLTTVGICCIASLFIVYWRPTVPQPIPKTESNSLPEFPTGSFLVVGRGGGQHFEKIGAALAAANPGATIQINTGNYEEALTITKSVKLVGNGSVTITGLTASAIKVQQQADVELRNLKIEGDGTNSDRVNTILVQDGQVDLHDCHLIAQSWDCIRAEKGSVLKANNCKFETKSQPALYAENAKTVELTNCQFTIRPETLDDRMVSYGVQILEGGARIRDCRFVGRLNARGIDCIDANDPIYIENCSFEACKIGVGLFNCRNVHIIGGLESSDREAGTARTHAQFTGCEHGIKTEDSSVTLRNLSLVGAEGSIGVRIGNQSGLSKSTKAQFTNCFISGFEKCVEVEHSDVTFTDVTMDCSMHGLVAGSMSNIQLAGCEFLNSVNRDRQNHLHKKSIAVEINDSVASLKNCDVAWHFFGVSLPTGNELNLKDCRFQNNFMALAVFTGDVVMEGGKFQSNGYSAGAVRNENSRPVGQQGVSVKFSGTQFRDSTESHFRFDLPGVLTIFQCDFSGSSDVPALDPTLQISTENGKMHITERP